VKATEIFAGICRNLPAHPAKRLLLNRRFSGISPAKWKTKERQVADKRQDHQGDYLVFIRNFSGRLRQLPKLFRRKGHFPEAFPNSSRRNAGISRKTPEESPKKSAIFQAESWERDRQIPEA